MGHKITGQVKAGKMDAVAVALHRLKQRGGNALGGLALIVAWEHPVDVGVIEGPEPLSHVHGKAVDAGNHQNFVAGKNGLLFLQTAERLHQPGADVHLLYLVAADAAHYGAGLLAAAEPEPLDFHALTVGGVQRVQNFLFHAVTSCFSTRASRLPG